VAFGELDEVRVKGHAVATQRIHDLGIAGFAQRHIERDVADIHAEPIAATVKDIFLGHYEMMVSDDLEGFAG
jgi:hypothetical protein